MKTAKEMFEELGYEMVKQGKNRLVYIYEDKIQHIMFDLKYKTIDCYEKGHDSDGFNTIFPMTVCVKELQAINKQVEELGWLDEKD